MKHRKQYPGATPYTDRHGKRRWRFRKAGKSVELGTDYGSELFVRRYEEAVAGKKPGAGAARTAPGTVDDLCARFYKIHFAGNRISEGTKNTYRGIIERFRIEHGNKRVAGLKPHHIEELIAEKASTPSAANNFRKRLAQLLDLAVKLEWLSSNPARHTKPLEIDGGGIHTWTEDEIARFYATHKPGTTAHTAMTLMLYTGAARVDAVKLGWFSIKAGRLEYRRQKTRRQAKPILVRIDLHPDLVNALRFVPYDAGTFLQTEYGKPRSPNGLGNSMRVWCDAAGLPECSAHGLRKAIARRLAEMNATAPQIAAITGHKTLSEVQRYIEAANREDMAEDGMAKLIARPDGEQTVVNLAERFAKKTRKQLNKKGN